MSNKVEYRVLIYGNHVSRETIYKSLDCLMRDIITNTLFYGTRIVVKKWVYEGSHVEDRQILFTGRSELFCVLYINNFFH